MDESDGAVMTDSEQDGVPALIYCSKTPQIMMICKVFFYFFCRKKKPKNAQIMKL
jgi:hypothetical protein